MWEHIKVSCFKEAMDFIMGLPPLRVAIVLVVSGILLWVVCSSESFYTVSCLMFFMITLFVFVCSLTSLLCHGARCISTWWKKRKAKKERESIETEARVRDDELKELLLSLPPNLASLLWFIYMNRPMRGACAAFIPCNNLDAKELHSRGLITSKLTPIKRGRGYDYACECYDYRLSENVISFLDRRGKELGEMWGYKGGIPALGKYQRADKAIILESGMR